jgi:hypothetical protein
MNSGIYTCNDRQVAKPTTGKTPVRTVRAGDELWFPALAKAEAEGRGVSDVLIERLREYAAEPLAGPREFTFANWPEGKTWARAHAAALADLDTALAAAAVTLPGDWLAIAAWLASTHHQGDAAQQKRVITGHILRRLTAADPDGAWRGRYRDSRHLSEIVQAILEERLPLSENERG